MPPSARARGEWVIFTIVQPGRLVSRRLLLTADPDETGREGITFPRSGGRRRAMAVRKINREPIPC